MKLAPEHGGYSRSIVRLMGSFKPEGTSAPDVIRDGKSSLIKSVAYNSAGNFTVTLADHIPLPSKLITARAYVESAAAPTNVCVAHVVVSSYSQSARTFQIQVIKVGQIGGSAAAPVVSNPDSGDRVGFELTGSYTSAGTDAA
jgi:hypothetical protein